MNICDNLNINFCIFLQTGEVEMDPLENTFIASAQSPSQQHLISQHPVDTPLFVEGGYTVWLRGKSQVYFTLRSEPTPDRVVKQQKTEEEEDAGKSCLPFQTEQVVVQPSKRSIHFLMHAVLVKQSNLPVDL